MSGESNRENPEVADNEKSAMRKLDKHDVYWCARRLPRQLADFLKDHPRAIVGGGFVRACIAHEEVHDVDVFAPDAEAAKAWAQLLFAKSPKVFRGVHETDNAFTVIGGSLPVQFVHRWSFPSAESLLESFDFTIACAAIWWNGSERHWESLADERFYIDLAAKRLVYRSPKRNEDAGGSMLRVLKFYQRGYRIPLDSLGAVTARLAMAVKWEDVHQAGESQMPTEERVAMVLTGLLREVDPFIDMEHVAHLPSQAEKGEATP